MDYTSKTAVKASAALSIVAIACCYSRPVQAVASADAIGGFLFSNFSQTPLQVESDVFTVSEAEGTGADAIADADAVFETFPTTQAFSLVTSSAFVVGGASDAFAQSEARVIGDFEISAGTPFSFDFTGFADLQTATESPVESAGALFTTQYSIFVQEQESNSFVELDFFNLFGEINTPTGSDALLAEGSDAIALARFDVQDNTGPNLAAESLTIDVGGRYERMFEQDASITLAEIKLAAVKGQNKADIPEPYSPVLWLLGVGGLLTIGRQHKQQLKP